MRTITALCAMLLGIVGIVLLSAGTLAVWRTTYLVVDGTRYVTERATDRLNQVETRLVRLEERVKTVSVNVTRVRAAAAALVQRALEKALAQTEVQQLLDQLDRLLEQGETHGESLSIVARLFEDIADMRAQVEGNAQQVARLREIAEMLDRTSGVLLTLRGELTALREHPGEPELRRLADLGERASALLNHVAAGIEQIRQYSVHARGELERLQREVRFWSITVALLITLVCVWLGLGQICLVGWGRTRLWPAKAKDVAVR